MKKFPENLRKEFQVFKKLNTPIKIQDFLDTIPMNFEKQSDTCRSPLEVLKRNEAHCFEGAMIAAAIFWYHGRKPLLLDLKTTDDDDSHVVALFKEKNKWGAISKTNHAVLRYRDPLYRDPRELTMSYFNEYFLNKDGRKTLLSFSAPFDLSSTDNSWLTSKDGLWNIDNVLDKSPHYKIIEKHKLKNLRLADKIEVEAGKITEWKDGKNKPEF